MTKPAHHRSLFISDIHLGTRGCQAEILLDFLRNNDADTIYLVGDIFDGWRLKRGWYWPQSHNDVVQKLLRKGRKGTKIIFVPGNHDEVLRNYYGTHFGGIEVRENAIFETASGKRYLVTHGDHFDMVVVNAKWLAHVGDWAYETALLVNAFMNRVRRLWGGQYWSLSKWAKMKVKRAVNFIGEYERVLATEARAADVNGVICGHIHHATITDFDNIQYVNCGDWVESCTAIAEDRNGKLHLIDWSAVMKSRQAAQARSPRPLSDASRSGKATSAKAA